MPEPIAALERTIEAAQTPLEKAEALNALAWEIRNMDAYRSKSLAEEALMLYNNSHPHAIEHEQRWLLQKALALLLLGISNERAENFSLSLAQAQEALAIYEQTDDKKGMAATLSHIGAVSFHLADYAKALSYYHKGLILYEEIGNGRGQLSSHNNIGGIYYELADYEKAMMHLAKSLSFAEASGDLHFQATAYHNIGNIYDKLADYEKAMMHLTQSLAIAETIGSLHSQAAAHHSIGYLYYERTDYHKALNHLTQSLALFEKLGDRRGQANSCTTFGQTFIKLRRFDEAETHLQKALSFCDELGLKKERYDVLENLGELYSQRRDFERAYLFYKQFHLAKEDVFNEEQQQKLTRLQIVHETEQAKKEADLLRTKNTELANALAEIHRLKELVTICAWTGKIKMNGKWVRVDEYLLQTFGISVSHGISEEAAETLRNELQNNKGL